MWTSCSRNRGWCHGQYSVISRGMYEDTKVYVSQFKACIAKFS